MRGATRTSSRVGSSAWDDSTGCRGIAEKPPLPAPAREIAEAIGCSGTTASPATALKRPGADRGAAGARDLRRLTERDPGPAEGVAGERGVDRSAVAARKRAAGHPAGGAEPARDMLVARDT